MRSTRDLVTSIAFSRLLSMVFCAICACCKAYSAHGKFSVMLSPVGALVGNSPDDSPAISGIFSSQNQAPRFSRFSVVLSLCFLFCFLF